LLPKEFRHIGKRAAYSHKRMWNPEERDTPTNCELCIFLRTSLGDGPDQPLPQTAVKAFVMPGNEP
jgi:hypothetical protein